MIKRTLTKLDIEVNSARCLKNIWVKYYQVNTSYIKHLKLKIMNYLQFSKINEEVRPPPPENLKKIKDQNLKLREIKNRCKFIYQFAVIITYHTKSKWHRLSFRIVDIYN